MKMDLKSVNDTDPMCASCESYLSERPDGYFCPRCASSTPYIGIINPQDADHPHWPNLLKHNPEMLQDTEIITEDHDVYGVVIGVRPDDDEVTIADLGREINHRVESLSELISELKEGTVYGH